MGNLVIAIIGVIFSVALMTAGISYISPNIGIVANNSASVDDEISGLLTDYQTLRTNVQHVPTVSDYAVVYKSGSSSSTLVSRNSLYSYNAVTGTVTRASALPGTGAGWTFNSSCNAANNAPCFCLTVTPSGNATASDKATYRSALIAARKLTTGSGVSQVAYNTSGCNVTGALQYGAWPDPNTATPTQPYTLVVATVGTPSIGSCTCTQGTQTYACGANWDIPSTTSQNCPSPWTSGTESQTTETPYSCVEQPGGTGSVVGPGTPIVGPWNTSACAASVTPACISPLPSASSAAPAGNLCAQGTQAGAPQPSGGNWTWTCTGSGTSSVNCSSPAIVDGQCNSIPATATQPVASTPECLSGIASGPATRGADSNWHWTCSGSNGGSSPNCTAPGLCAAGAPVGGSISFSNNCTPTCPGSEVDVNNVCVAAVKGQCGISVDTCNAGTVTNPQTYSTYSQWYCDGNTGNASDNSPLCGACNAGYTWNVATSTCVTTSATCNTFSASATAPTGSLCGAGTASAVAQSGASWTWSCTAGSGVPAYCTSPAIVTGQCGSDNGGTFSDYPWNIPADYSNTCLGGGANAINASYVAPGGITWQCNGPNGGTPSGTCNACFAGFTWNGSTCVANIAACNSFGASASAPTGSLCASGTPSGVTQNGTNWAWTCTDAANDPAINCTSPDILAGQCGSDNGGTFASFPWFDGNPSDAANTCLGGLTNAVNGGTPAGEYTWKCSGPNGGAQSGTCIACQSGYGWNGSGCAASASAACTATTNTYDGCSFNVGALTSGQSETASNTATGYTGSETATCTNGAWSYSEQSCIQSCPSGQYWNGSSCLTGCTVPAYINCSKDNDIPPSSGNYATGSQAPFGATCSQGTEHCVAIHTAPYVFCTQGIDECVFASDVNAAGWTDIGCIGAMCSGPSPINPPTCTGSCQ